MVISVFNSLWLQHISQLSFCFLVKISLHLLNQGLQDRSVALGHLVL